MISHTAAAATQTVIAAGATGSINVPTIIAFLGGFLALIAAVVGISIAFSAVSAKGSAPRKSATKIGLLVVGVCIFAAAAPIAGLHFFTGWF